MSYRTGIILTVLVALILALYGAIPSIIGLPSSHPAIAFFPPFTQYAHAIDHIHLGAEYWNVADSLCRGKGYSGPFGIPSGPTAWMPPALPTLLALLNLAVGQQRAYAAIVFVLINAVVFAWVVFTVAQATSKDNLFPKWILPICVAVVLLASFNDNFQRTHDGTYLLFIMQVFVLFILKNERWPLDRYSICVWGVLGGVISLSSPAILIAWLVMTIRYTFLLASSDEPKQDISTTMTKVARYRRAIPVILSIGLAFTFQVPWLTRNYIRFHTFVPVKTNGAFELEQSLLRDDDGVVDFGRNLHHPYTDRDEAAKHARLGEIAYIEQRAKVLRESFWEHRWKYVDDCFNRFAAILFWQMPLTPGEENFSWTHITRFLYALPWIVFLTSAVPYIPLSGGQKNVLIAAIAYLVPYMLLSYYSRYMIPLMGVRCLLLIWGLQRWHGVIYKKSAHVQSN